jgi:signal transduction histidine kinase
MQAELLNAEHHQRVARLATGLAHDFNNLLSLIKFGFQQIQETIPEKNGTNLDQFRMIFPAIEQGLITTKCLMSLGSDRVNKPERVHLRAALQEVYDLTAPRLVDRLEYVIACDPDMVVETDRSLLVMALLNVVLNARDVMPYGGQLTVSARALNGTSKEQITVGELDNTAYVEIKVKDTGYGIPPEDIEAIFEPGVSKSRYRDGAGLGLFMVKQFVLRTKSGLNVVSTPDAGTEVCFYIKAANTPEPAPTGRPKTLLVKG